MMPLCGGADNLLHLRPDWDGESGVQEACRLCHVHALHQSVHLHQQHTGVRLRRLPLHRRHSGGISLVRAAEA